MLHLVNKIYLELDEYIDMDVDRVVISSQYGHPLSEDKQNYYAGQLLDHGRMYSDLVGEAKTYPDFISLMSSLVDHGEQSDKSLVIYCDHSSFVQILSAWYKTIFRQPTVQSCLALFKSYIFKQKAFQASRFSKRTNNRRHSFSDELFASAFETIPAPDVLQRQKFVNKIRDFLSVEYLLASYLSNGGCVASLKNRIKPLVSKDIEKYLYELKELFLVHLNRKELQDRLGLTKNYSFDNFYEIVSDPSEIVQTFFTDRIWTSVGVRTASSSGTINLSAITDNDVKNIESFAKLSAGIWGEVSEYEYVNGDFKKLGFLKHITTDVFTDQGLKEIIEFEINDRHSSGSFYSLDIGTVNIYFVDFLLDSYRENKLDNLKPYIVA